MRVWAGEAQGGRGSLKLDLDLDQETYQNQPMDRIAAVQYTALHHDGRTGSVFISLIQHEKKRNANTVIM